MLEIGVLPPNRTLTGAAEDAEHDPRPLLHRVMSADPSEGESAVVGAELSLQSTLSQQQQFDHVVRPGESIQAAIERAAPGERLLLDAGEHTEGFTLRRDILIMGRHEPSTSESESSAAVPPSSTVLSSVNRRLRPITACSPVSPFWVITAFLAWQHAANTRLMSARPAA